jgi:hypothetical protein
MLATKNGFLFRLKEADLFLYAQHGAITIICQGAIQMRQMFFLFACSELLKRRL